MKIPEPLAMPGPTESRSPSVLVVDDDQNILAALGRTFRHEPYELLATKDPFQALEWLKYRPVDVLIADEFMPAMLGTEFLDAARRLVPASASIILTGYRNPSVTRRAALQKVDLVLSKPWEDELLRRAVRLLLGRGEGPPPTGYIPDHES